MPGEIIQLSTGRALLAHPLYQQDILPRLGRDGWDSNQYRVLHLLRTEAGVPHSCAGGGVERAQVGGVGGLRRYVKRDQKGTASPGPRHVAGRCRA